MKYVVIRHTWPSGITQDVPIVFPLDVEHMRMFNAVKALFPDNAHVVSAGEVQFDEMPRCFGGSTSLKINSRPDRDARLIYFHDLTHGLDP